MSALHPSPALETLWRIVRVPLFALGIAALCLIGAYAGVAMYVVYLLASAPQ